VAGRESSRLVTGRRVGTIREDVIESGDSDPERGRVDELGSAQVDDHAIGSHCRARRGDGTPLRGDPSLAGG
jgi:hypothetical protein